MNYPIYCIILLLSTCHLLSAQSEQYVTLIKVKKNNLYGYLNDEGKEVIPCTYDYLLSFSEGLVGGRKGNNWVYLDTYGKVVIDLQDRYTVCGDFKDGKAYVSKGETRLSPYVQGHTYTHSSDIRFINRQGEEVLQLDRDQLGYQIEYPSTAHFSDGLLKLTCPYLPGYASSRHGYVDTSGQWKIPPRFNTQASFAEDFKEGLAVVGLHPYSQKIRFPRQRYGFIDKKGQWVIMPDYHEVTSFKNGIATATIFSKRPNGSNTWTTFFIDKNGQRLFPDSIQTRQEFHHDALGIFTETEDFKSSYALADTLGNILTNFDMKFLIAGDLWAFKRDSLFGFMNNQAEIIIPPKYKSVRGFKQGLCIVTTFSPEQGYTSGVINLQDEWVIPMQHVYQYDIKNGIILQSIAEPNPTYTYLNRKGKKLRLNDYQFKKKDIQWVKR